MGDNLKLTYHGDGTPDPARVTPLLEALKVHKGEVVEHLKKEADFEIMFKNAMAEIDGRYQAGVISYIKGTHPRLWQRLVEMEDRLSEMWLSGNEDEFIKSVNKLTNLYLQAIGIFKGRSAQGELFGKGGQV